MGGKIFNLGRKSAEDFLIIRGDVTSILEEAIEAKSGVLDYFTPRALLDKESHGDIDVVICCEHGTDVPKFIKEYFKTDNIHINHNIFSFPFSNIQVDFIRTVKENFETNCNYIANGAASMFLGKVSRRIADCIYGITGLEFLVRHEEEGHEIGRIQISKDPKKIIEFLGYDYKAWKNGFNSEKELFNFLISSPYIGFDYLESTGGARKHRKREEHCPQYARFIEFAEKAKPKAEIEIDKSVDNSIYLIETFFKIKIRGKYMDIQAAAKRKEEIRAKWSGADIKEITGIEGKELGKLIGEYKESFGEEENYFKMVESSTKEEIIVRFKAWFSQR